MESSLEQIFEDWPMGLNATYHAICYFWCSKILANIIVRECRRLTEAKSKAEAWHTTSVKPEPWPMWTASRCCIVQMTVYSISQQCRPDVGRAWFKHWHLIMLQLTAADLLEPLKEFIVGQLSTTQPLLVLCSNFCLNGKLFRVTLA